MPRTFKKHMAASLTQQLSDIEEQIDGLVEAVEDDGGASPALRAVVDELHTKAREARDEGRGADGRAIRDHVIEVEQAADSAKKAAEADGDISDATRRAVFEAHSKLRALKEALPA
jgi:hypothetical protein